MSKIGEDLFNPKNFSEEIGWCGTYRNNGDSVYHLYRRGDGYLIKFGTDRTKKVEKEYTVDNQMCKKALHWIAGNEVNFNESENNLLKKIDDIDLWKEIVRKEALNFLETEYKLDSKKVACGIFLFENIFTQIISSGTFEDEENRRQSVIKAFREHGIRDLFPGPDSLTDSLIKRISDMMKEREEFRKKL